jgi:hypothetical protein
LALYLCGCAYGTTPKAEQLSSLLEGVNIILESRHGQFIPGALVKGFRTIVGLMVYPTDDSVPQVTNEEFYNYIGQDRTEQTISNLNGFLKDLADDSETIPTVEGNAQQYNALRITSFGLMAQLYVRAYYGLFTTNQIEEYRDFVSRTVTGVYFNGALPPQNEQEWDEVLSDDGDALLAYVPNDDINVHIWHLASALRKLAYTEDYQSDKRSILVIDGAMLLANIMITMDYVLTGSRNDFSQNNFVYRYSHDGAFYLLNNFANERTSSVAIVNTLERYAGKMLNAQFYPNVQEYTDPDSRFRELGVQYPAQDVKFEL